MTDSQRGRVCLITERRRNLDHAVLTGGLSPITVRMIILDIDTPLSIIEKQETELVRLRTKHGEPDF